MPEILIAEKTIALDHNRTLAYRLCGELLKVQFVFLHGLGGCAGAWAETQSLLYDKFHYSSFAMDLPGHGFSSDPVNQNNLAPQAMAEQIVAGFSQLNVEHKPLLVGHCLGGIVATQVAAKNEAMFSGLVLINTIIKTPFYMRLVNPFGISSKIVLLFAGRFNSNRPSIRRNYLRFRNSGDFSLTRLVNDIAHTSLKNHLSAFAPVFAYDAENQAKKLTIPIKILAGTSDKLFLPFVAKHMAAMLPRAKLTWISKGNHVMVLAKHTEIVEELVQFHDMVSNLKLTRE